VISQQPLTHRNPRAGREATGCFRDGVVFHLSSSSDNLPGGEGAHWLFVTGRRAVAPTRFRRAPKQARDKRMIVQGGLLPLPPGVESEAAAVILFCIRVER